MKCLEIVTDCSRKSRCGRYNERPMRYYHDELWPLKENAQTLLETNSFLENVMDMNQGKGACFYRSPDPCTGGRGDCCFHECFEWFLREAVDYDEQFTKNAKSFVNFDRKSINAAVPVNLNQIDICANLLRSQVWLLRRSAVAGSKGRQVTKSARACSADKLS